MLLPLQLKGFNIGLASNSFNFKLCWEVLVSVSSIMMTDCWCFPKTIPLIQVVHPRIRPGSEPRTRSELTNTTTVHSSSCLTLYCGCSLGSFGRLAMFPMQCSLWQFARQSGMGVRDKVGWVRVSTGEHNVHDTLCGPVGFPVGYVGTTLH